MKSSTLEPTTVRLAPGHPGEGDPAYIARRGALSLLMDRQENQPSGKPWRNITAGFLGSPAVATCKLMPLACT